MDTATITIDLDTFRQMGIEIELLKGRVSELERKLAVSEKTREVVLEQNFKLQKRLGMPHDAASPHG